MEDVKTIKKDLKKLDSEIDRLIMERSHLQGQLAASHTKRDKQRTLEDKVREAIYAEPVAFPRKASVAC